MILLIQDFFAISYKRLIELHFLSALPFITNLSSYSTKLPDVRYSFISKGSLSFDLMSFLYIELTRPIRLVETKVEFWDDNVDYMCI